MKLKSKYLNIVYYFALCLFVLFGILKSKLGNMDELWNFLFAKNIAKGLHPYTDFNVVVTPLSMFFNSVFLYFNQNLIVFRLLNFIYYLVMILILDRIMNLLKIENVLKYVFIFISTSLLLQNCYFDYNFIQLLLIFLLIYLCLKNKKFENKTLSILIPIVSGLTVINKQSTGLFICFVTIILIYLEKKHNLKFLLQQILIMLLPSVVFVLYLLQSKSFFAFYDLCILGLVTFTNKMFLPNVAAIIIISYITMILLLFKYKNKELTILFLYAIASLFVIFPIIDFEHGILALIIPIIFFTYILNINVSRLIYKSSYSVIILFIVLFYCVSNIYSYIISTKIQSGVYKSIPANIKLIDNIDNVSQYVLKKSRKHNVYILDFTASLYNLNINKYNKYFDLFMNGNFGVSGKKEMYSIIDKKNQIILINNSLKNWQCPDEFVNYVLDNYDRCGSIEQFDVYCN